MGFRRCIAIALVVLLGTFAGTVYAEPIQIDFSSYTDDEVVDFLEQVQEVIAERGIVKSAVLEKGVYIGGQDIPVGRYILTKEADTEESGLVWLKAADDPDNVYPSKLYEFVAKEEESSFYITLEEGDTLSLPFRVTLTISAGVVFH